MTGQELWILRANSTWDSSGGADCQVTWTVTGTQDDATSTCGSCDYSLSLDASLDASLTDCPEALYEGSEGFTATYNVKVKGSTTTFYFATSGNPLGLGQTNGSRSTYLTDGECLWF